MKTAVETKKEHVVTDYHGTLVEDPYRWLEDADDAEVKQWGDAQNALTARFLETYPKREEVKERLTGLWDFPKYSVPRKEGDYTYYQKNDGLQNQSVFYRTKDLASGDKELVLDPNTMNEEGTAALTNLAFTKDGKRLAYGVSFNGSDWQEIRIRNLETNEDESDLIKWCKFSSIAWNEEGTGFYYNRFPEPGTVSAEDESNYNKVYWHTVGTPQEDDKLIYEDPANKGLSFNPILSDDYKYLILSVWKGTENKSRIYYKEAGTDGEFIKLLADDDARYDFVGNDGTLFYFVTNADAPKERVIAIDIDNPKRGNWKDIIPEQEDVLAFASIIGNRFAVCHLHNAHYQLKIHSLEGEHQADVPLPDFVTIAGISGKRKSPEMFIGYTSYLAPLSVVRYDIEKGDLSTVFQSDQFSSAGYETVQVFYPSKDGTEIPMFLTHKKGIEKNGANPVLLYGYGGFNVSLTPTFSPAVHLWLEEGGIYAVANLRGGGEFGDDWYNAGTLERKQNVFDDFIAAAEWLLKEKYTSSQKLSIMGGSNGGLLVGACITQRPDLYGAAVCQVPVIDMLRYHKFTVGRYWVTDFGNAEESAEQFKYMYAYSPLHNVKEGTSYPPTLITTADTDDRVVPLHAKKFAATLQAAQAGDNPILLRIEKNAGHGLGKPTVKIIEEQTDIYSFLFKTLQVD